MEGRELGTGKPPEPIKMCRKTIIKKNCDGANNCGHHTRWSAFLLLHARLRNMLFFPLQNNFIFNLLNTYLSFTIRLIF